MKKRKFNWEDWISNPEKCKNSFDFYINRKLILLESEKEFLTRSHIKKTDYNIDFINFLLEKKVFYDWIIIGCYYAIYQASLALLSSKGYSSKKHNSTLCALIHLYYHLSDKAISKEDIELISKSSLAKEEISYFVEAKNKRETASYGISPEFSKIEAEKLREKTILFVNKVESIIENL